MTLYKHFPVLFQCSFPNHNVWNFSYLLFNFMTLSNIFPYFFKSQRMKYQLLAFKVHDVIKTLSRTFSPYFFKTQRLKYPLVAFLVHDVIKHFPVLFPVIFETTLFEILVSWFSSTWRYKNIFPYFFSVLFSNHNVWNISSLLF